MVDYAWIVYMDNYVWSTTRGAYVGMLMMLENDVSVLMDTMRDMVLMVEIYENDMGFIIERYYGHMI